MPLPTLPLEILIKIIDYMASNASKETLTSLRACASTGHTLLPLCQKYIFAKVTIHEKPIRTGSTWNQLSPTMEDSRVHQFALILQRSPTIGGYIKHLNLHFPSFIQTPSATSLENYRLLLSFEVMRKLENLRAIEIYGSPTSWKSITSEIYQIDQILTHVFALPSLVTVSILDFTDLPISFLLPLASLSQIDFKGCINERSTTIIIPDGNNQPIRPIKLALQPQHDVTRVGRHCCCFDFARLFRAKFANGRKLFDLSLVKVLRVTSKQSVVPILRTVLSCGAFNVEEVVISCPASPISLPFFRLAASLQHTFSSLKVLRVTAGIRSFERLCDEFQLMSISGDCTIGLEMIFLTLESAFRSTWSPLDVQSGCIQLADNLSRREIWMSLKTVALSFNVREGSVFLTDPQPILVRTLLSDALTPLSIAGILEFYTELPPSQDTL